MSVREEAQMSVDAESAGRRMEGQCRSSQKYLLLHVWCGLLTMALVIMAAFIASIKPKSEQPSGSQENSPAASARFSPEGLVGKSSSYIELETHFRENVWMKHVACESCSLCLHQDSIYVNSSRHERALFFFYAQVVFRKNLTHNHVMLIRNATEYPKKDERVLVTGESMAVGSVWLGKMVTLTGGDSVRLSITGEYSRTESFWGAFQLH
ncbi:lymphotoxin-alpha [Poecilia reticulata]|uniref:Uncharacterized LOC103477746 n=1 Tax=Poecilia reticulata TaxID=8081 RepID=A0A3P9N6I9_POERE|nr:PREDICTED: uncharacterized protein LOC103477746 [Poecilia reticulata]